MVIDFPVTVLYPRPNPQPVTVTTVEELEALPDGTAMLLPDGDMARRWHFPDGRPGLKLILADLGRQGDLSLSFDWPGMSYESYLPATVLYPTAPQADVLHITGPCNTGDVAPMLCGITKVVETPRSPEQPVCQACAAIQTSERNDLDQRAKAQADVLAEIRELHSPSERASGLACSECSAEMDVPHPCETILIIDEHEAKS